MRERLDINNFLDGKVQVYHSQNGYKAGLDTVLLASLVQVKSGSRVLDIGSGVGVASLCLAQRVSDIEVIGVEKDEKLNYLAKKNVLLNDCLPSRVKPIHGNILDIKLGCQFDAVMMNPPYFKKSTVRLSDNKKYQCNVETDATLEDFVKFAFTYLKNNGYLYVVCITERLEELLKYLKNKHWGNYEIIPIYSFMGQSCSRFLLKVKKLGKDITKLHFGIVIHNDDGSYSASTVDICKYGKDFAFDK